MLSEAFRTCKPLKTFEEVQGLLVRAAPTPPAGCALLILLRDHLPLPRLRLQLSLRKVLASFSGSS